MREDLQPEIALWEDPAALRGGEPGGAGFLLSLLAHADRARWLRPGATVLLETHVTHPAALYRAMKGGGGCGGTAASMLQLLPATGIGGPVNIPLAAAQSSSSSDYASLELPDGDERVRAVRRGYEFVQAYADSSARPRFVELRWRGGGD